MVRGQPGQQQGSEEHQGGQLHRDRQGGPEKGGEHGKNGDRDQRGRAGGKGQDKGTAEAQRDRAADDFLHLLLAPSCTDLRFDPAGCDSDNLSRTARRSATAGRPVFREV
jgi:hypothetical protein